MPIDIDLSNWNKENSYNRPKRSIKKCLMVQENARNSDNNGGRTSSIASTLKSGSGKALMVNQTNQHDSTFSKIANERDWALNGM